MKKINLFWVVVLFAIIGSAIYWQLSRPRTTTHLHGNETLEDHVHTHRGPFSHDHYHVGIRDGTAHSHPEEHLEAPKSLQNWIVVGHVHRDDQVSMFYAKCQLEDHRLIVSKSLPDLNLGPRSTLVFENLDIESSEFSVVMPVSNASDRADLAN